MTPRPLVVGLTGCTRSGKSWVARLLSERLGIPASSTVGQDNFWRRAVRVRAPDGEEMVSEEEPDCTDHGAFAEAIQQAIEEAAADGRGYVIAEGFQLLHDERVPRLLDHVFYFDLGRDDCIARRSAKRGPHNPNPMSARKCEVLVWPAHERYVKQKVEPLEGRVQWLKPANSPEEAAALAEAICAALGVAGAKASPGVLVPRPAPPEQAPEPKVPAKAPLAAQPRGGGLLRLLMCGCGS